MGDRNIRLIWMGVIALCFVATTNCKRSEEADRAASESTAPWTLILAAPIDHLDVVAREPMILEHPDGSLFVGGFGASRMKEIRTDELTLWRSRDGGTTWARINVGPGAPRAQGAVGNSDMDLAVAPDGTLYFVTLFFDVEKYEGRQVCVGVSKDVGATWTWTLLSKTRFDDRPWIEVAPDGMAHVIWNDGAGVCHAVSQDAGLTWTERDRIHPQGGSSHLAMGPNGELAARITPLSASGNRYDEGVDLVAVSTDRGMKWQKYPAPGVRDWTPPSSETESTPRWVEPLAWDAQGFLYSLWTGAGGVWLARSADQGRTWTTWRVADGPEPAFYPYLVARGPGELAATWFSARQEVVQAHAARIDVAKGPAPPRVVESQPFEPDCWQEGRSPDAPPLRSAGGEYLAVSFLRNGGLAVVGPIENRREKRFGFSLWQLEEHRGEAAEDLQVKGQPRRGATKSEKVYSESPTVWYEAAGGAASISSDGQWGLYFSGYMRMHVIRLIDMATGRPDAERLTAGMDRLFSAAFIYGDQLARLGERGGQRGWFLSGPGGLRLSSIPLDAVPRWSPNGSAVAYFLQTQADKGLFVSEGQAQRHYSIEGLITGFAWAADGRLIYASAWQENGSTSVVRINLETGSMETLFKDLDAAPWSGDFSISNDGRRLYLALASPQAPIAESRHQPDADRDLDIYELDVATGVRRVVVEAPGDDFAPCLGGGFLYWTHNDIRDSVVVVPSSGGAARVVLDGAALPYWSPDSERIAFTYGPWRLADFALNLDAGQVAVDSDARPQSKMKPLVTGYHEDFTPAWSPDGRWMAFHSHRSATPVSSYDAKGSTDDLYLRRVSGSGEEIRLTDFGWEDGVADWSPDGRRLVFDSWERGGAVGVSKPWVVTIDPLSGKLERADPLPLPGSIKNVTQESWSPDGEEIALEENQGGDNRALWVISVDGKRAVKLAEYTSSTYGGLDWTPDGKMIVFGALAGKRMQIFSVKRSGGPPRQLTDDPANLMHPQVSPDGRWIACTRLSQSKEIWRRKL
jgi:Tol biopolymer transport system component